MKKWWVQYDLGAGMSTSMTEYRETPPIIGESSVVAGRYATVVGFVDMPDIPVDKKRKRVKKGNEKVSGRSKRVR